MIRVSDACYSAMQSRTDFYPSITITLEDGTILRLGPEDCTISGNTVIDGAAANTVPLGVAVCKMVSLSLMNEDDRFSDYDFYGAEIVLNAMYPITTSRTETIYIGRFRVVTPETRGTVITITAADLMYKADRPYTSALPFPTTARQVINEICATLGYTAPGTFANQDFAIKTKPEGVSYRQVIGGVAGLAGGNAYITRYGGLAITGYDMSPIDEAMSRVDDLSTLPPCHILQQWMQSPTVDTDDITITGIRAEVDQDQYVMSGEDGYVLVIDNPVIKGREQVAVDRIGAIINGLTFRQFSGNYIGYPIADFMDPAIVIDRKGNMYRSFLTDIKYTFAGPTELSNSAEPVIRNQNRSYSTGTRTIRRMREYTDGRISAYDLEVQNIANIMSLGLGLYMYKMENEDGSAYYVMGNHDTLESSDVRWMITGGAIAVSHDYGETWVAGVTAAGTAAVEVLSAVGINADWIRTGSLVIMDGDDTLFLADIDLKKLFIDARNGNGDPMFRLDSTNGTLDICADSFSLTSGQSLDSVEANAYAYTDMQTGQALSDAEAYTDDKIRSYDPGQSLTKTKVFNLLTDNGARQGIWMDSNGEIYINMSFLRSGILEVGRTVGGTYQSTLKVDSYTGLVDIVANSFSLTSGETLASTLSDAKSYTNTQLSGYAPIDHLSQAQVFNKLTNNGQTQGIIMRNGLLYINWEYASGGTLKLGGINNGNGVLSVVGVGNDAEQEVAHWDHNGLKLYNGPQVYDAHIFTGYYQFGETSSRYKSGELNLANFNSCSLTGNVSTIIDTFNTPNALVISDDYIDIRHDLHFGKISQYSPSTSLHQCLVLGLDGATVFYSYISTASSSSRRYKDVGRELTSEDIQEAYNVKVYFAKYKDGYLEKGDQREGLYYPMFVAEQMHEHLPDAVDYLNGQIETWNERALIPVMFQMIKDQKATIDRQAEQIRTLEERLARIEEVIGIGTDQVHH